MVFAWASWMLAYNITLPGRPGVGLFLTRAGILVWVSLVVTLSFTLIWQVLAASPSV